jgi:hypothetical protein
MGTMIFDAEETPDTRESVEAAKEQARQLAKLWNRRAAFATIAFVASCAVVYPFLAGHALHRYWDSLGKYLLLLTMALLVPFVMCVGIAINTRMYHRSLGKIDV